MKNKDYRYCGSNNSDISNFEDLLNQITGEENTFQNDEDECGNPVTNCSFCKRDESFRYCGKDYPNIGVYKGDHYDDVIDAILTYLDGL